MIIIISTIVSLAIPITIIAGIITIHLIARETAILEHHEEGTEYKGFWSSVLWPIATSGGISHRFLPIPWFDFTDKDEYEIKHLVRKNWLILIFWLLFALGFLVAYFFGESNVK